MLSFLRFIHSLLSVQTHEVLQNAFKISAILHLLLRVGHLLGLLLLMRLLLMRSLLIPSRVVFLPV